MKTVTKMASRQTDSGARLLIGSRFRLTDRRLGAIRLPLLPLLMLALACGLTDPDLPAIAGTWTATDQDGDSWKLDLSGTTTVSGSYLVTFSTGGSVALSGLVTGNYDYPAVSLALPIDYGGGLILSCSYRGTMGQSGETFSGTQTCAYGGESATSSLDFRRQPD